MKVFHPVQTRWQGKEHIDADVVLRAYEVYKKLYGPQEAMIDLARGCRGGFGVNELIAFLYARTFPPEQWQARVDEALER